METLSTYAQPFFEWLFRSTFQASIVVCLILLIQALLRNRLTVRWHYALWLILIVRMVLPWAPQSRFSIYNLAVWEGRSAVSAHITPELDAELARPPGEPSTAPQTTASPEPADTTKRQDTSSPAPSRTTQASPDSAGHKVPATSGVLPLLWLAGALLLGGYIVICNVALWRAASVECPSTDTETLELLEECRTAIGLRTIVALVPSEKVKTPVLLGFVRPRLLVPKGISEKLSREELRYVFLHELAHVKRHDIALGWLTALLQVLHWFNPLVWLAFHRMRSNRESACDALVLSRMQGEATQNYGLAMVSLLEHFSVPQALPGLAGILESKSQLKRRIAMITEFKNNSYRFSPLALALTLTLACVVLPNAKHTRASETSAAKAAPGMVVRRVWARAWDPHFTGAPSPDGKYLSGVNWRTGDLAIHELATGTNRNLTNEGWDKGFAVNSVFSPDSKQVAYYWWNEQEDSGQLRIVGLDGSGPRVVHLTKGTSIAMPAGWSADGKHILALGGTEDEPSQILLIPVEDGDLRVLKTLEKKARGGGYSLSPDGRYLAYTFVPGEDSANRDISVVAVDGSRDIPLVRHVADDFVLGWAPDGRSVVFASDRTGSMGIWAIELADGKPQRTPQLLKPGIGEFHPMGFTKNGSYYYGVSFRGSDAYITTYDPQKRNVTGKPVLAVKRYEGSNAALSWSPDGRYMACVSRRPGVGRVFLIRSVETGQVRELSPDIKDFHLRSLRWSADGRSLLGAGQTKDVSWGLLKMDAETGEVTSIVEGPGLWCPNCSADDKAVFYVRRAAEGWQIVQQDLTTNEEKELFRATVGQPGVTVGGILGLALSPDGKQLAFQDVDAGMLKVLPAEGGQPRELVKFEGKATIAWAPDGSHLLYANWLTTVRPGGLWRISADGGEPQKLDLEMRYVNHVRFHPDGRQITFTARAEGKSEVWAIENFLPATAVAKPAHQPNFRKIRIPTKISWETQLSPDGRKVALASDGKLWIMPLLGKLGPELPGVPDIVDTGDVEVLRLGIAWSGDGKWIAFNENFETTEKLQADPKKWGIYVVSAKGGEPKKVCGAERGELCIDYQISLTPNGETLAFSSLDEGDIHVYTVPVEGGRPRQLTNAPARDPAFSPDGKMIAYVGANRTNFFAKPGGGLWVVPASGGTAKLVADIGHASCPLWSPDSSMIAFRNFEGKDDVGQICIIPIGGNGEAAGEIVKIDPPKEVKFLRFLAGWTPENKIGMILQSNLEYALYTVPAKGGKAGQVTSKGFPARPRWSPDGKRIFHTNIADKDSGAWARLGAAFVPAEGGPVTTIPIQADAKFNKPALGGGNNVSPDGSTIAFAANRDGSPMQIWTLPVDGGKPTQVSEPPTSFTDWFPCWSPDGKSIAFVRTRNHRNVYRSSSDIYIVSSKGGDPKALTSPSDKVAGSSIAWSPNGRLVAFFSGPPSGEAQLKVIPVAGGESRVAAQVQNAHINKEIAWSPDSRHIAVNGPKGKVVKVSMSDGNTEEIDTDLVDTETYHLTWSPDGSRLAFGGVRGGKAEFWVMENFLSEEMRK